MIARAITRGLSLAGGRLAELRLPRRLRGPVLGAFARAYGVRLDESACAIRDCSTFQDFFTRPLRAGLRPIEATADDWTSPVDALWLSHVRIHSDSFFPVKGNFHSLAELLGDGSAAQRLAGGFASTFYLRPGDYHRIHAPCDARIVAIGHVPGTLLPVNRLGQRVGGVFGRNERVVLHLETARGPAAMIWVGALMVGSMSFSHPGLAGRATTVAADSLDVPIAAGEELGMFRFGSTVIVVGAPFAEATGNPPSEIRVGQRFVNWKDLP